MRAVVWPKGCENCISIVAPGAACGIPQLGVGSPLSGIQRTKPAKGKGRCEGKRQPLSLTNYRKCVRVIREAFTRNPHDLGPRNPGKEALRQPLSGSPVKDSSRVARCIGVRDRYCPLPGIAMLRTAAGCRALLPLQPPWRRSAVSGPQYAAPRMLSAAFQLSG